MYTYYIYNIELILRILLVHLLVVNGAQSSNYADFNKFTVNRERGKNSGCNIDVRDRFAVVVTFCCCGYCFLVFGTFTSNTETKRNSTSSQTFYFGFFSSSSAINTTNGTRRGFWTFKSYILLYYYSVWSTVLNCLQRTEPNKMFWCV